MTDHSKNTLVSLSSMMDGDGAGVVQVEVIQRGRQSPLSVHLDVWLLV